MIRKLDDIYSSITAGDIILKQLIKGDGDGTIEIPELVIAVGVSVWDMALVVYYTQYKAFNVYDLESNGGHEPEVLNHAEWSDAWHILGHWKQMPSVDEMKEAMLNKIEE